MKRLILILIVCLGLATTFLLVAKPIQASDAEQSGSCQCVGYVVNRLFKGVPRPGYWPTAASMASANYWGPVGRSRQIGALPGDVIIIGPEVVVGVTDNKNNILYTFSNAGDGAGHVGFILNANYSGQRLGWFINMRSANWYIGGSTFTDANCNNVNDSTIFIPNGDATSFWR